MLMSAAKAGRILGVHQKTIREWCRLGTIPASRLGRHWLISESTIQAIEAGTLPVPDHQPVESDVARLSVEYRELRAIGEVDYNAEAFQVHRELMERASVEKDVDGAYEMACRLAVLLDLLRRERREA